MFAFGHANCVHEIEQVLRECIRRYVTQHIITDGSHATALHLNIKQFRLHIAHKHHHFQWLDVNASGDQCHRNGNTEIPFVAKILDELIGITRTISYFLHETVTMTTSKDLFGNLDNVVGVSLIKRKDKCLG